MKVTKETLVSIIILSYNEELDIEETLKCVINLNYSNKEIIVVDDSTDNTPNIIRRYEKHGVRMVRQKVNRGVDGACNLGIREATGEIVVILTADNQPEPDFVDKILPHYKKGADLVLVQSEVKNNNFLYPRFMQAQHDCKSFTNPSTIPYWTEGFSCRREAALDVGMFPKHFPIPIRGGTDGYFGKKLAEKYRRVMDTSIVIYHVIPESIIEFWKQHLWRGQGASHSNFFLREFSIFKLFFWIIAKTIFNAAKIILIFPKLYTGFRISRFSPRKLKDWMPMSYCCAITSLAHITGEWMGLYELFKYIRSKEE